ncbi:MAG TPA: hypothetical protein VH234_06100 [Candidatus Saccharimonadales bacterium]|nr:hypothetical protein [Candidatus Saccharimonadales bacterium]
MVERLVGEGFADEQGVEHPRHFRLGGVAVMAAGVVTVLVGAVEAIKGNGDGGNLMMFGMDTIGAGGIFWVAGAVADAPYVPEAPDQMDPN